MPLGQHHSTRQPPIGLGSREMSLSKESPPDTMTRRSGRRIATPSSLWTHKSAQEYREAIPVAHFNVQAVMISRVGRGSQYAGSTPSARLGVIAQPPMSGPRTARPGERRCLTAPIRSAHQYRRACPTPIRWSIPPRNRQRGDHRRSALLGGSDLRVCRASALHQRRKSWSLRTKAV